MNTTLRTLLCLPLLLSLGCRTIDKLDPTSAGDVADQREEREAMLVSQFEESRNEAQFLAAQASWEHGDTASARQSLEELLGRDPANREARLLLAELLAANGLAAEAENHLRLLIGQNGNDAQAQFSLGLLLETNDRSEQAMAHFQRAAEIDPANELFALSAQTGGELVDYAGSACDTGCGGNCSECGSVSPASYTTPGVR